MKKYKISRQRIFEIIQIGKETDISSRLFDFTIVGLIIINILIAVGSTFDELEKYYQLFNILDAVTVVFFSIELALRLGTADFIYKKGRIKSALKYLISFNGIIELLSIVPFFMPSLLPRGLVAFRIFRVVRILHLFESNTYSDSVSTIMIVLRRKRSQMISSMLIIFVIMIMASLVMYGLENESQPEVFSNAFSGIWWATSTVLTVGYGDIYPVTILGKAVSILITFLGVGMVAIPTGILSAGFTEYIAEHKGREKHCKDLDYCPYCGEKLPNKNTFLEQED